MTSLFKIDKDKPILYSTTELFKVTDNPGDQLYQTKISIPIISIVDNVKTCQMYLFGTIDDWFNLEEIKISYYGIIPLGKSLKQQAWQNEKDLEVSETTLITITRKGYKPDQREHLNRNLRFHRFNVFI